MAAPSNVGSASTVGFSSLEIITLTIIPGFTAGNTVAIAVQQAALVERTVSAMTDDGGNSYSQIVQADGPAFGFVQLHAKVAVAVLTAGGVLTMTLSDTATGRLTAQQITASTLAGVTDTFIRGTSDTSQQCGTGMTTAGDVYVFALACCTGDHSGVTPSDSYATVTTPNSETVVLYKTSGSALVGTTGPFTTVTSRGVVGCMTAFYTLAGGTDPDAGKVGRINVRQFPKAFMRRAN